MRGQRRQLWLRRSERHPARAFLVCGLQAVEGGDPRPPGRPGARDRSRVGAPGRASRRPGRRFLDSPEHRLEQRAQRLARAMETGLDGASASPSARAVSSVLISSMSRSSRTVRYPSGSCSMPARTCACASGWLASAARRRPIRRAREVLARLAKPAGDRYSPRFPRALVSLGLRALPARGVAAKVSAGPDAEAAQRRGGGDVERRAVLAPGHVCRRHTGLDPAQARAVRREDVQTAPGPVANTWPARSTFKPSGSPCRPGRPAGRTTGR